MVSTKVAACRRRASDVAAKELKFNPVYYVYYVDDKIDHGLEFVEEYFFGVQNP